MYQFIWPFVLFLLPLPWIVRQVMKPSVQKSIGVDALKVPFFNRLKSLQGTTTIGARFVHPLVWILAWVCFVIAAARPVWVGHPIPLEHEARNIVLTLDVSGSMEEEDFDINGRPITRLDIVKQLASDFIEKRKGDNLGLVIFGSEAYTYIPLSPDTQTLNSLMDEINVGIAGSQTAMGDALAMATQTASAVPDNARIVILMSDGFANAGVVQMDQALQVAQKANVKVYTIGIGSDQQALQDFLGFVQTGSSLDLDETTLQKIAETTGGRYFRAKSTADLKQIYDIIDQLETTPTEENSVTPRKEIAYWFVLAGLMFWILAFLMKGHK